jgi:hypothetical protein
MKSNAHFTFSSQLSVFNLALIFSILTVFSSCKDKTPPDTSGCQLEEINSNSTVEGYGILAKLPGIWNGSVYSPTPLGSFPEWIVDFRPISEAQVSAKNELDSLNDIFMSFFIVKIDCKYKIAFRNGGGFAGNIRNSYLVIDSVSETATSSFYRFVDPIAGKNRVYSDITFKQDSLIMHTYTNKFNTVATPQTHMIWRAKLKDQTATQNAITHFNFPQKKLVKDFTTTFDGRSEAIYYNTTNEPYPETAQPYIGKSTVTVNITNPTSVQVSKKVLIIVTTQPLFNGFNFNAANLKYRSRYVLVGAKPSTGYTFNYMHPGTYYVNAIYDVNGDGNFSSGDYINNSFDVPLTLSASGIANATVNVNFLIP